MARRAATPPPKDLADKNEAEVFRSPTFYVAGADA
jgi:hypothetical protein